MPEAPMDYFENMKDGFLVVFRVYKINNAVNEDLLEDGRKGRNFYFGLRKDVNAEVLEPVIKDDTFKQLRNSLINLLDKNNYLLESIFSDYWISKFNNAKEDEEDDLANEIAIAPIDDNPATPYSPNPQIKKDLVEGQAGLKKYPRDLKVAINALKLSDYKCEINGLHPTFTRKRDGKPYTEPHHLIPLSRHFDFDYNLDVEANIVSLCSHCHNLLHYGNDFEELLRELYEQRKEALAASGILIEFQELLGYY